MRTGCRKSTRFYALPRREVGLYVLVDFGTYEIPLFLWLKYTMSLLVFKDASAMDVTVSRLNSQRTLCIHAFKNHISTQDVMPSGGSPEGITPTQFGSRINANELELFSKAQDFILQELARCIHTHTHKRTHLHKHLHKHTHAGITVFRNIQHWDGAGIDRAAVVRVSFPAPAI